MIVPVNLSNIDQAARIHAVSWQASHRAFCAAAFLALHTPEHQKQYLLGKMQNGSRVFMLIDTEPAGVVSVIGSLIEDLYVLPEMQNRGYGTALLKFAVAQCAETPTLWILENNTGAELLYTRLGFQKTGRTNAITEKLAEIEFVLPGKYS